MNVITLNAVDLSMASVLIVLLALSYFPIQRKLGIDVIIAAVRALIQLSLIGLILTALFENAEILWIALLSSIMLLAAAREAMARQQYRFKGLWRFSIGTGAMFLSSFSLAIACLSIIIQADPWYTPQYAVPLLGMLLGNTMNAVALSMERLTSSAWQQQAVIEQRLMLGQSASQALTPMRKDAVRSGMTPIINAMATAGIVNLPGMMTGQILAGSAPHDAVKYQILILFLISVASGMAIHLALWIAGRRLFDERDRLKLDRLSKNER